MNRSALPSDSESQGRRDDDSSDCDQDDSEREVVAAAAVTSLFDQSFLWLGRVRWG
jgi:hypothetical protein